MRISDGQGRGYEVGVDSTNRIKAIAIDIPHQHHASVDHGKAFQIAGAYTLTGAGTFTILSLVNTSETDYLVGTYLRPQVAGLSGGTFGTATYMTLNFGGARSAGGTLITPVNMNRTRGNAAAVTTYDNNPTVTGTLTEFDRWYPTAATEDFVYNKRGTLILGTNDSLTVRFTTDHTSGLIRFRLSFFMFTREHHL